MRNVYALNDEVRPPSERGTKNEVLRCFPVARAYAAAALAYREKPPSKASSLPSGPHDKLLR